ncbi:hypothetical protein HDU87_006075 [Geranomyces variabilis]|uniref:Ankyrin n=1 Tax=Geranomyces variabilis TaxID=109894 RepID=A0AAD5TH88_9FUNG|nr:hypothetical protein HDU87_006075 [Geranomyces variabilis]
MPRQTTALLGQRLNDAAALGDLQAVLAALLDGAHPAFRDQHQRSAIIATIYGTTSNSPPITPTSFEEATQSRPEHASILRVLLRHILSRAGDASEPSNRVMFDELVDRPQDGPWLRGITPLALAAYLGKAELVRVMLEEGADVDARDANGATALMYAARDGRADVAEVLLDFHARPQLEDINAWNAERYGRAHPAVVQLLAHHQKAANELVTAASVFRASLLKDLIARKQPAADLARLVEHKVKADSEARQAQTHDADGPPTFMSPPTQFTLLSAIKHQDLQSVYQVLKALPISSVSTPDAATGVIPLHYALRLRPYKHPESEAIVRVLVALGANVNARNVKSGKTPLAYAVRDPYFFPDGSPQNKEEMERAVYSIVTFLLESGADVNAVDLDGNYALHYAVRAKDAELVRLLLSGGRAHAAVANKKGKRPADVCEDADIREIIQQYLRKPSLHRESWSALRLPYGPGTLEQALAEAQDHKLSGLKNGATLVPAAVIQNGRTAAAAEAADTSKGFTKHISQPAPADSEIQLRLSEAKADAAEWKARFEQSRMQEKEALSLVKRLAECVGTDSGRSTLATVGLSQAQPRKTDGLESSLANADSSLAELDATGIESMDVAARKRSLTSLRQKKTSLLKEAGSTQRVIDELQLRLEAAERRIAATLNDPSTDIASNRENSLSHKASAETVILQRAPDVNSANLCAEEELETALLSRLLVAAKDRLQQLKVAQAGLEADNTALRQKLLKAERDAQTALTDVRAKAEAASSRLKQNEAQFRTLAAKMLGLYPPSEFTAVQEVSMEELELHVDGLLPRLQHLVKDLGCRDPAVENQKFSVSAVNALRATARVCPSSPSTISGDDQNAERQARDAVLEAVDSCLLYVSSLLHWSTERKRLSKSDLADTDDIQKKLEGDETAVSRVMKDEHPDTAPAAEAVSSLPELERETAVSSSARVESDDLGNVPSTLQPALPVEPDVEAPRSESAAEQTTAADTSSSNRPASPTRESLSAGPLAIVPSAEDINPDAAATSSDETSVTNADNNEATSPTNPSISCTPDEGLESTDSPTTPIPADPTSADLLAVPASSSEPSSGARTPNTLERLHTTPELEELMNSIQRAKSAMSMADDTRAATPDGQVKRREYTDLVKTLINTMRSEDEGKPSRSPNGQRALRRPISPMPIIPGAGTGAGTGAGMGAGAASTVAAASPAASKPPALTPRPGAFEPNLRSSFEDEDDNRRGTATHAFDPSSLPSVSPASIPDMVAQKEGFPRPITEARPLPPRKLPPVASRGGIGPLPTLVEEKDKEEEEGGRTGRFVPPSSGSKRPGEKTKGGFFRRLMRSGKPA